MPTTTTEFYNVLKAFKEKDPNGNGKADEIPPIGGSSDKGAWMAEIEGFLASSFLPYKSAPWEEIYDNDVKDTSKIIIPMI